MLGKPQKYVGETIPIESSEKEYSPCRMQSTMETASCPVADAIRDETYLQFPVAEKYRIIGHLRNFILIIIYYTTTACGDKDGSLEKSKPHR